MRLINIGFGNMVSSARLLAIVSPESAPIKRIVQEARDRGMLIDATYGRRTRAVIIMDTDHVILSAILPETIAGRAGGKGEETPGGGSMSGKLIVISGPSGVGKSTVVKGVMAKCNTLQIFRLGHHPPHASRRGGRKELLFCGSCRVSGDDPGGKAPGVCPVRGQLLWNAEAPLNEALAQGKDVLLDIEVQGALRVKARRPDAVLIFMLAPSFADIEKRSTAAATRRPRSWKSA